MESERVDRLRSVGVSRVALAIAFSCAPVLARADTIPGREIAVRSSGEATGDAWTLRGNGYVGTYLRLDKPGDVRVRVASNVPLGVVIGDRHADAADHTFALPAGTHFVRVQRSGAVADASTTVAAIDVAGGTIDNAHTDANALAAADTYVATGRRASVMVKLPGVAAGTSVHVKLRRLDFAVGGNASGARNVLLADDPPSDSDAARFQRFAIERFGVLVPSNGGKWVNTERDRGRLTMEYVDAVIAFAKRHGQRVRMHALIWDSPQDPQWARTLLDAGLAGDLAAKEELRKAISDRIDYYCRDRGVGYHEVDVNNESVHQPKYAKLFGIDGLAAIYKECADALRAAGSTATTFVNEYNVLQYSQRVVDGKGRDSDPFANWYREHAEALNAAGAEVGGIGVQYYADPRPDVREPHSAARIHGALQNLATTGLAISLTEFGLKRGGDDATNARILDETLRLTFGTPDATGFLFFGFWEKAMWDQAPAATIVDKDWRPTPLGEAFARTMSKWTTELDATVGADGAIRFDGFQGDYELTVGGEVRQVKIVRGRAEYEANP